MNGYDLIAVMFVSVFGMITVVSCRVAAQHAKVRIAEATNKPANITLTADAKTGEVIRTEEEIPEQIGVNQTGKWADEAAKPKRTKAKPKPVAA